jgi:hypothetical protein
MAGSGLAAGWGVAMCIGGRGWQCGHLPLSLAGGVGDVASCPLLLAGGVGNVAPAGRSRPFPPNGRLLRTKYAFSSGNRPPHANSSGWRRGLAD